MTTAKRLKFLGITSSDSQVMGPSAIAGIKLVLWFEDLLVGSEYSRDLRVTFYELLFRTASRLQMSR
jgi:hypothetical protein